MENSFIFIQWPDKQRSGALFRLASITEFDTEFWPPHTQTDTQTQNCPFNNAMQTQVGLDKESVDLKLLSFPNLTVQSQTVRKDLVKTSR